ncbi:TonB-dependent receptor [Roseivirga sp. UBA838]|uniref:TonB-dependent receptor plug domain-containing protein n=1 Tax=Roseivirga sp. UBA838 TaxID=1947393 RepID=UPI00257D9606|nr:TonB-dependent receptor [Roseivirga sp. UBA838]
MKWTKILGLGALLAVSGHTMVAQENKAKDLGEVVVTGNRFETPIEKSGKVIYKITAKDIEHMAGRTVADLINALPGINVNGVFGTPGSNLEYSIRGGRNRHTLVLIDGLPINDASSIANDYDLRLLNASAIEYIEVLKGGASTLYGTNAAAGVINIKLKEANGDSPKATLSHDVGSFRTANSNLTVQGKEGNLSYLAAGGISTSEGISAAEDNDPNLEFGNDGFFRYSGRTRLGYEFNESFKLGANLAYENMEAEYDNGAFSDGDNRFDIRQVSFGVHPEYKYDGGTISLKANFNRIRREFISAFPSVAKGKNLQMDLSNQYVIAGKIKTIAGVQYQSYEFENGDEQPGQSNIDPYVNASADLTERLTLNAGLRLNNNSEYGSNLVYMINPVYTFNLDQENKLKLFGSYSTAFVAPSLFQLFANFYGNPNLEAESTESLEFGISLYLSDKFTLNAEYFNRTEENAIDFVSRFDNQGNYIGGGYENVTGERKIDGFEADITWQVIEPLQVSAHYADYNFGDPSQFYRIPSQKYGLSATYRFQQGTRVGVVYNRFGERQAAIFSDPFLVELEAFNMLDLNISHELFGGDVLLSGAVYNLLDEDFVGTYGFTTRPVNFSLGVTARF